MARRTGLRRMVAEAGISRYRLAKRTGISEATLHRLISGAAWPNLRTVAILAEALGLPVGKVAEVLASERDITEAVDAPRRGRLQAGRAIR